MNNKGGMLVNVYRSDKMKGCAGISTHADTFVLCGDGVPEIFNPSDPQERLVLVRRMIGDREYVHAQPFSIPKHVRGPSFGGNFIYSDDSRFPSDYPIPIHDRFESISKTCEEASSLSTDSFIPCGRQGQVLVRSGCDGREYAMCAMCADHAVKNRGMTKICNL